jgi:hypothetical protein
MDGETTITAKLASFIETAKPLVAITRIVKRLLDLQSGRRDPP